MFKSSPTTQGVGNFTSRQMWSARFLILFGRITSTFAFGPAKKWRLKLIIWTQRLSVFLTARSQGPIMSSTSTISAATSPAPEQTSPRSSWNARQFPSVSGRVKRTAISVKEFAITSHSFGILMPVDHDDPISRDFSDFPGALLVPRFNGPTRQNLFYQHTIFPFKYLNCELTGPASAKRSIENVAAGLENPAASAVGEGSVSDPVPPEPATGPWLHVLLFTALSASFSNSKHFQHLSTRALSNILFISPISPGRESTKSSLSTMRVASKRDRVQVDR